MKNYLSIGEVAKIKNIGIKSLRYYEKIGVLIPAYINPETNYRYYSLDQLMVLDLILLCIELQIPLKDMKNYANETGQFQIKLLLDDGKKIATQRIRQIEDALKKIEINLNRINESAAYQGIKGLYTKRIQQRHVICIPNPPKLTIREYEEQLSQLFVLAQENNIYATFPFGTIENYDNGHMTAYTFLETIMPDFETDLIRILPEGDYLCCQIRAETFPDPKELFATVFDSKRIFSVIITGPSLETINYDELLLEFQVLA